MAPHLRARLAAAIDDFEKINPGLFPVDPKVAGRVKYNLGEGVLS
jgi:hypothetical protein